MARFALDAKYSDIPSDIINQLKRHLLDTVASIVNSTDKPTVQKLVRQIEALGEGGKCKAPLVHQGIAADRAAQMYTALLRYPDFMDNFLGKEATCHPSDNVGSLLAAAQLSDSSGKDFLTAMAIAYAIECRLVEETPVMIHGFDHTVLLAYSLTAALGRMLDLTDEQLSHAIGMAGCGINPMVTCRSSYTYEWKGFASSFVAKNCMGTALIAKEGLTGPINIFEGPKGFDEVHGMKLNFNWQKDEDYSLIRRCILKRYNAEAHTQSAIEAALELKEKNEIDPRKIESIDVTTFLTAFHIVGGGAYGDRKTVRSKEQADHSLPYVLAVALLDGDVYPEQFEPNRILSRDVQSLLKKVNVQTGFPLHKPLKVAGTIDPYTRAYPKEMRVKVEIKTKDGRTFETTKKDYHGFHTRPFGWDDVEEKFNRMTDGIIDREQQKLIVNLVKSFEKRKASELIDVLVGATESKRRYKLAG